MRGKFLEVKTETLRIAVQIVLYGPSMLKLIWWVECSPIIREAGFQSHVKLYQRLRTVPDAALLNTQHYKVPTKVHWSNPGKGVAHFPTPSCSSYWKGSLRVTLDCGRPLMLSLKEIRRNRIASLCCDRDEIINHIISECIKLAQNEYETRYDWMGKVIKWELSKHLNFTILPNGISPNQNPSWKWDALSPL